MQHARGTQVCIGEQWRVVTTQDSQCPNHVAPSVSRLGHFHTLPEVNAELKSLQKRVAIAGGTSPQLSRGVVAGCFTNTPDQTL